MNIAMTIRRLNTQAAQTCVKPWQHIGLHCGTRLEETPRLCIEISQGIQLLEAISSPTAEELRPICIGTFVSNDHGRISIRTRNQQTSDIYHATGDKVLEFHSRAV